jgi:hypothetical protein
LKEKGADEKIYKRGGVSLNADGRQMAIRLALGIGWLTVVLQTGHANASD